MILSQLEATQFPEIFQSITGALFMGTPHRGTGNLTSNGLLCAALQDKPDLCVDDTILQAIKTGSEVTTDLLHEISMLSHASGISLFCFFEQQPTKVGKIIGKPDLEVGSVARKIIILGLTSARNGLWMRHLPVLTASLDVVLVSTTSA